MTMTMADVAADDGVVSPRADRPRRRQFTAEYKARVLAEYDAAEHGTRGAILRREGLYSSHLIDWRRSGAAQVSGSARVKADPRDKQIEALRTRAEKAETELARAKAALEIVGKAHALLEMLSESAEPKKRSPR